MLFCKSVFLYIKGDIRWNLHFFNFLHLVRYLACLPAQKKKKTRSQFFTGPSDSKTVIQQLFQFAASM